MHNQGSLGCSLLNQGVSLRSCVRVHLNSDQNAYNDAISSYNLTGTNTMLCGSYGTQSNGQHTECKTVCIYYHYQPFQIRHLLIREIALYKYQLETR